MCKLFSTTSKVKKLNTAYMWSPSCASLSCSLVCFLNIDWLLLPSRDTRNPDRWPPAIPVVWWVIFTSGRWHSGARRTWTALDSPSSSLYVLAWPSYIQRRVWHSSPLTEQCKGLRQGAKFQDRKHPYENTRVSSNNQELSWCKPSHPTHAAWFLSSIT